MPRTKFAFRFDSNTLLKGYLDTTWKLNFYTEKYKLGRLEEKRFFSPLCCTPYVSVCKSRVHVEESSLGWKLLRLLLLKETFVIKALKQQSNRHPEGWCGGPVLIQMTALTSKTSKQCKPQHWQKTLWGSAEAVDDQSRHCLMVTFSSLIATVRGKKKKEWSHLHPQAPVNWGNKTPSKSSSLARKETVHQKKCLLG